MHTFLKITGYYLMSDCINLNIPFGGACL